MILFAQLTHDRSDSDFLVGGLAVLALCSFGLWKLVRWIGEGPNTPDPWNDQVAAEIAHDAATPLCHQCLAPHPTGADFCPDWGASVGQYTNVLPYPCLFSVGHLLRTGTFGKFKHSSLTVGGFLFLGLIEYAFFAPVYWFMLLRNTLRKHEPDPSTHRPVGEADSDVW